MAKQQMIRKISGVGMAGALVLGSAGAMALDFDVTAQVKNALEVTSVDQMSLGTIFATSASTGAVGILRLAPAGGMTQVTASDSKPSILPLGGQVPARASVAVGADTPFTVKLPAAITAANLVEGDNIESTFITGGIESLAGVIELRLGGEAGNPSVARLYMGNFSVGGVTGGSISNDTSNAAGGVTDCTSDSRLTVGAPVECVITPLFDATAVEFAIGADVITDTNSNRTVYQQGAYTGTFEVTASY